MFIDIREYADELDAFTRRLAREYRNVENPEFLQDAAMLTHDLPAPLRRSLLRFRLREEDAVCRVRGFPVNDRAIGATPTHWRNRDEVKGTGREDFYLILCCHLLGDAVAWATEQAGHLVHEVIPIKGNEGGQLGTSTDQLAWHTEDAFHPERMDYVALLCLRNHDAIPTTYASVDELELDDVTREELFRPAYPYLPDEGNRADRHLSTDETGLVADLISSSHARVLEMFECPDRMAALFGSRQSPYLRVHPHYIADFSDDQAAADAFDKLKSSVNAALKDVPLEPGELFFIDNFKAVHGRREIPGRFDGTDRWLKRAFIVRDLRKTRALRVSAHDRVVY